MNGMMEPRLRDVRYVLAGAFYRMAYTEWGDPSAPVVVCVHGLTGHGREFDVLAASLAQTYRVICPDLPGRGGSDWLPDPALYHPLSYVQALSHLLARLGRPVAWIGTSLGGICGLLVAANAGNPITRLVLNDIGPFVPQAALRRIREGMETFPEFESLAVAEHYLRRVRASLGALTDAQWRHLVRTSTRLKTGGGFVRHYDPAIAEPIRATIPASVDLWERWAKITAPVMAIRGQDSTVLLPQTLERMAADGAETFEVPGAGHAPALMDEDSIAAITAFLGSTGR